MPYHSRKYFLNEDFFSSWTHEMAYVLGFWYADGHMRHMRSYRIIFSSKDKDHLINIRNSFTSNSPVVDDRNSYSLIICSKKLYLELSKLGGTPHKSTSQNFQNNSSQILLEAILMGTVVHILSAIDTPKTVDFTQTFEAILPVEANPFWKV